MNKGKVITDRWHPLAKKYQLPFETSGLPALVTFVITSKNWLKYKTLITQEMVKKGFLAGNFIYSWTEHTEEFIDSYFHELDFVFNLTK